MRRAALLLSMALGCSGAEAAGGSDVDLVTDAAWDIHPQPLDVCDPGLRPHFLQVDPSNARLFIDTAADPPVPATVAFHASSDLPCGEEERDVTSEATFTLEDATVGAFSANVFTSAIPLADRWGVATGVTARFQTSLGLASLTLIALRITGSTPDAFFDISECGDVSPSRFVVSTSSGATSGDMTTSLSNDPTTSPVDASALIQSVRAMSEGDATVGCAPHAAKDTDGDAVDDTFPSVAPGEHLCFEVVPKPHAAVTRKPTSQFVAALLSISAGGVVLDHRALIFGIPPITGVPC